MKKVPEGDWRGGGKFIVWDPETTDTYEGELETLSQGGMNDKNDEDEDED